METQNPERLEFRIYAGNSRWLHWDNLKGNYQQIFNRYEEYLATLYNNYVLGCLTVRGKENPNFKKLVKLAERNNCIRFKNKDGKLRRKEVMKNEELFPKKVLTAHMVAKRRQELNGLFDDFQRKKGHSRKVQKMISDGIF
jgi:hypothetical protein